MYYHFAEWHLASRLLSPDKYLSAPSSNHATMSAYKLPNVFVYVQGVRALSLKAPLIQGCINDPADMPVVSASLAEACLRSVPLDVETDLEYID